MQAYYNHFRAQQQKMKASEPIIRTCRKFIDGMREVIICEYQKIRRKQSPRPGAKTTGHMFDYIHNRTHKKHPYIYPNGGVEYWNSYIKELMRHLVRPKDPSLHFFQKPHLHKFVDEYKKNNIQLNYDKVRKIIEDNF